MLTAAAVTWLLVKRNEDFIAFRSLPSGGPLGAMWACSGISWDLFLCILGCLWAHFLLPGAPLEVILVLLGFLGELWAGRLLRLCWACLGFWAHPGLSLELCWARLGTSWDLLGFILGYLGEGVAKDLKGIVGI